MLNFSNNVTKVEILEALTCWDSSIRICRITAGPDGKLIVEGKQGDRGVVYVYQDRCWVEI